jgi:hypothetical protein
VVTGDGAQTLAEVQSFGQDGQPGGTLSLAPLTFASAVTSDGDGGYIACGVTDESMDSLYRFRPDQDPEPLSFMSMCSVTPLDVTPIDGRPVLVYEDMETQRFELLDLATDETTPMSIDASGTWSAGGGRLARLSEHGLEVWDLASAQPVDVADISLPWVGNCYDPPCGPIVFDLALSDDGATLAALVGEIETGRPDVVVVDLASGAELFRATVQISDGGNLAYDGTTLAVASTYAGPVHVFDIATGAERTLDVQGKLP